MTHKGNTNDAPTDAPTKPGKGQGRRAGQQDDPYAESHLDFAAREDARAQDMVDKTMERVVRQADDLPKAFRAHTPSDEPTSVAMREARRDRALGYNAALEATHAALRYRVCEAAKAHRNEPRTGTWDALTAALDALEAAGRGA